jgi:hypothetical protein
LGKNCEKNEEKSLTRVKKHCIILYGGYMPVRSIHTNGSQHYITVKAPKKKAASTKPKPKAPAKKKK